MLRKLIFVVSVVALTLVACGRQVTPDRTGTSSQGLQPGQMQIKFNTAATMDFSSVWYVLAFNTSGTGGVPYAINGNSQQNWLDYSFEIIVYQLPGQVAPQARLIQFLNQPNLGGGSSLKQPTPPLTYTPQQLQLNSNCNNQQTQFCITLARALFAGYAQQSPSPGPTGSPTAPPFSNTWYINWFTVSPGNGSTGGQVIDAPGANGATNTNWVPENPPSHNYDITTSFDAPWNAIPPPGWPQVTPAGAQIAGGEVLNAP